MWMLPPAAWGEYEDKAVVERLDLAAELARWSGVGTADEPGPHRIRVAIPGLTLFATLPTFSALMTCAFCMCRCPCSRVAHPGADETRASHS